MTPSQATRNAARQALINRFDSAATPGRIRLLDASGATAVTIPLQSPAGITTPTGIALSLTDYVQVNMTSDIASAVGENGDGDLVADFSVGLPTDNPAPDLPIPSKKLYAGSFIRLSAEIDCY